MYEGWHKLFRLSVLPISGNWEIGIKNKTIFFKWKIPLNFLVLSFKIVLIILLVLEEHAFLFLHFPYMASYHLYKSRIIKLEEIQPSSKFLAGYPKPVPRTYTAVHFVFLLLPLEGRFPTTPITCSKLEKPLPHPHPSPYSLALGFSHSSSWVRTLPSVVFWWPSVTCTGIVSRDVSLTPLMVSIKLSCRLTFPQLVDRRKKQWQMAIWKHQVPGLETVPGKKLVFPESCSSPSIPTSFVWGLGNSTYLKDQLQSRFSCPAEEMLFLLWANCHLGFPGGSVVKNPPANAGDAGFDPWVGNIPWRRKW